MTEYAPETEAPPGGEELHMPAPSIVPFLNAIAVAVFLIGLAVSNVLIIAGAVLFLVTLVRWIRDVVRDVAELPADHAAH